MEAFLKKTVCGNHKGYVIRITIKKILLTRKGQQE